MMTKNKGAPRWTTNMRQFIVNQLATWKPYKQIWIVVTNPAFTEQTNIPYLDPEVYKYDLFRKRCGRIPKNEIAIAHDEYQCELGAIKWGDDKSRVQGLSDLIDDVSNYIKDKKFDHRTTGTAAALIGQLRGLYEQLRKEVSADKDRAALAASGTRILLTNPKNVEIDTDYLSELLLVYRTEIGGLHNLDLTALNMEELKQLRDKCQSLVESKITEANETDYEVLTDESEDIEDDIT